MNPAGAIAAASVRLAAPPAYWQATPEERRQHCNGCGTKSAIGRRVPDRLWGLSIRPACDIHDWMYDHAAPRIEEKQMADRVFLENMLAIVRAGKNRPSPLAGFRSVLAAIYYAAVALAGNRAFWNGKDAATVGNVVILEN